MNLRRICFLWMWMLFSTIVWPQDKAIDKYSPAQDMHYFKIGSTIIPVKTIQYGTSNGIVMINLHDDEITSVVAAKNVLQETGGLLIKIENNHQRQVRFILNKRHYRFDPNRIFSRTGIIATLKKNKSYSPLAVKKIQAFAAFILKKIPPKTGMLIAVHNNDEGRLSIHSYDKGGIYERDAQKVNIGLSQDPDNFYFTTDKVIFDRMASLNYNAVLQENNRARDDGSLSVYYGRRKKSYVNVETNIGQVGKQEEMIKVLLDPGISFGR